MKQEMRSKLVFGVAATDTYIEDTINRAVFDLENWAEKTFGWHFPCLDLWPWGDPRRLHDEPYNRARAENGSYECLLILKIA